MRNISFQGLAIYKTNCECCTQKERPQNVDTTKLEAQMVQDDVLDRFMVSEKAPSVKMISPAQDFFKAERFVKNLSDKFGIITKGMGNLLSLYTTSIDNDKLKSKEHLAFMKFENGTISLFTENAPAVEDYRAKNNFPYEV